VVRARYLVERVDALLALRDLSLTDVTLGIEGRVWTGDEANGLESILKAAGYPVMNGVVSKRGRQEVAG
jgi:hypothetical protein